MACTLSRLAVGASLGLILMVSSASRGMAASVETSCDVAAAKAERDWNIPPGILSAVGTVESGRAGRTGRAPWPWTINAAGRGSYHESKGDAIASVLAIMIQGFPYIDVGCFQIDIAYHAGVFGSLDDAFDPEKNAQAAAMILLTERSRSPDWNTAVARYHSATPGLGSAYLDRVRDALPSARLRALSAQAEAASGEPAAAVALARRGLPVVIYGSASLRPATDRQAVAARPPQRNPRRPAQIASAQAQP